MSHENKEKSLYSYNKLDEKGSEDMQIMIKDSDGCKYKNSRMLRVMIPVIAQRLNIKRC